LIKAKLEWIIAAIASLIPEILRKISWKRIAEDFGNSNGCGPKREQSPRVSSRAAIRRRFGLQGRLIMTRTRKTGFTIIEVLVVFAIMAVMIALLIPAVQQAREAARRNQCLNNLKQLGTALNNYHEMMRVFPSASYVNKWSDYPTAKNSEWSWGSMLLPYLDRRSVFEALDINYSTFEQAANDPNRRALLTKSMPYLLCPSDPGGEINENRPFFAKTEGGVGKGMILEVTTCFGKSNYIGCNGNHDNDGIFDSGNNFCVSCRDITDGLSNTILIGERSTPRWAKQAPGTQGPWAAIWAGQETGRTNVTSVWCLVGKTEYQMNSGADSGVASDTSNIPEPLSAFGSMHAGGAQFLFADGSARFISDQIEWNDLPNSRDDVGVYHLLGSRADGHPVADF
jgi:prepilin-type processing-associated H-X9-DG protein